MNIWSLDCMVERRKRKKEKTRFSDFSTNARQTYQTRSRRLYKAIVRPATHIYPGSEVIDDHVDNFVLLILLHRFHAHFSSGHANGVAWETTADVSDSRIQAQGKNSTPLLCLLWFVPLEEFKIQTHFFQTHFFQSPFEFNEHTFFLMPRFSTVSPSVKFLFLISWEILFIENNFSRTINPDRSR